MRFMSRRGPFDGTTRPQWHHGVRAVSSNNVTGQECQLAPAAPGVRGHLHGIGGSHHPAVGDDFYLRKWLSRAKL